MPYNGSGTYTRTENWTSDAAANLAISATKFDTEANDMASAFNNCLTRDGQGVPSGALTWTQALNLLKGSDATIATFGRSGGSNNPVLSVAALDATGITLSVANGVLQINAPASGNALNILGTAGIRPVVQIGSSGAAGGAGASEFITANSTSAPAVLRIENFTAGDGAGAYALIDLYNGSHYLTGGIASPGHVGQWAGTSGGPSGESTMLGNTANIPFWFMVNSAAVMQLNAGQIQGYGATAAAMVDMTPDKGSFTATYTGFAANPTPTATWNRVGNLVTIRFPFVTGTSNAPTFTITGLPAEIVPALAQIVAVGNCEDNGVFNVGLASLAAGSSTITLGFGTSGGAWTGSGTKGFGCTFSYLLNN